MWTGKGREGSRTKSLSHGQIDLEVLAVDMAFARAFDLDVRRVERGRGFGVEEAALRCAEGEGGEAGAC